MLLKHLRLIAVVASAALLVGCGSTYQPQTSSIARVRVKGDRQGLFHWNNLELMAIEDKPTGMPLYGGQFYRVDSGRRHFVVRYQGNRRYGGPFLEAPPIPVFAELKPRQDYEITGKFAETAVGLYVRDIKTGKPAGPVVVAPVHYQSIQPGYTPVFIPVAR